MSWSDFSLSSIGSNVAIATTFVGLFASPSFAQIKIGTIVRLEKKLEPIPVGDYVCGPPAVGSLGKVVKSSLGSDEMPMVLWENRSNCSISEERMLVPINAIQVAPKQPPLKDDELEARPLG